MKLLIASTKFGPDRNDVVTQELLDNGRWKQAVDSLDRRMKKSQDDKLLVRCHLKVLGFPLTRI